MSHKQQHWCVHGVTRSGLKEHPHERGATHGASQVHFETQVDILPGEVLQVLTEKVCDVCGLRYYRDRCPAAGTMMHQAFERFEARQRKEHHQ